MNLALGDASDPVVVGIQPGYQAGDRRLAPVGHRESQVDRFTCIGPAVRVSVVRNESVDHLHRHAIHGPVAGRAIVTNAQLEIADVG